jgi:transposase-like protein
MIQETITYTCSRCGSINIVRNGKNKCGNRQYHCRDCGAYRVLKPQKAYPSKIKQTILRACKERSSLRGIQRIFGVARQTVSRWIKAHVFNLPLLVDSLLPAHVRRQVVRFVVNGRQLLARPRHPHNNFLLFQL